MSRTDKDAPYWVKANRSLSARRVSHYGCEHSPTGGVVHFYTDTIDHAPDWHPETLYRVHRADRTSIDGVWLPYDRAVTYLVLSGMSRWLAVNRIDQGFYRTRTRLVYGPWTTTTTRREKVVRDCDLDTPGNPDGPRWRTCTYDTVADFPNRCWDGPERAHVRDTLRAAAADYNAHGDTDIEPVTRQNRRSPWKGGYWD